MALVDIIKSSLDSISQISEHLEGSVIYLDAGCTESFQFLGAFSLLLELGVRAVCSLENMSYLDKVGALASESDFSDDPNMRKGLLYKLLTRVLGKYDVPGLEYHSSTVGRLFKSGFGRFGLGQVREAHEALSESGRPDIELILGSTTLLTPDDMIDLLLGNSSYI